MLPKQTKLLEGLTILDIGTLVAGPMAATLLADFGARVIKIEQPEGGDPLRHLGPQHDGVGLWWSVDGRNKESVTADLRTAEGQAIVRGLVPKCDAIVENFRPGTVGRWGLGFEDLITLNPDIVMLSVSGYGQTGPYADRAGYDRMAWAFSGLMDITGFPDRPPLRPGTTVVDYQTALYGAFSMLLILYAKQKGGCTGPQYIDLSLYESAFRFTETLVTAFDKLGVKRERSGNQTPAAAPGDHFLTRDGGYLILAVASDSMFKRLCAAMGQPLHEDSRFARHGDRWAHIDEINGLVRDWILSRPTAEIIAALEANGLAYSTVYNAQDILKDEHYEARGSIVSVEHDVIGELKMPAPVPRLPGVPRPAITPGPSLGAHTDAVLSEMLGYDAQRISELRDQGII